MGVENGEEKPGDSLPEREERIFVKGNRLCCAYLAVVMSLGLVAPACGAESQTSEVAISPEIKTIAAGHLFSLAADRDGTLWGWGLNEFARLGNSRCGNGETYVEGTKYYQTLPTMKVMDDVVSVSAGEKHGMAIQSDGTLWYWGGRSGIGSYGHASPPEKLAEDVAAVSAGYSHSLFIKKDGSLWAVGTNNRGEIGNNGEADSWDSGGSRRQSRPVQVMENVVFASAGKEVSLAVQTDGSLWAWGSCDWGQVGDGSAHDQYSPVKIMEGVVMADTFQGHCMALKRDGSLWAWGNNDYGQIGDGTKTQRDVPVKVLEQVVSCSAGSGHSLAVKTDGSLWAWGGNQWGQLGQGYLSEAQTQPVKVMDNVAAAEAGTGHSLVQKTDGTVWCWGSNHYGQVGNGRQGMTAEDGTLCQPTPVKVMENTLFSGQAPAGSIAYMTEYPIKIGKYSTDFAAYAVKDENGYDTNYVRLRDLAKHLKGTAEQFNVGWNGAVSIVRGEPYQEPNRDGVTFSGNRVYEPNPSQIYVDWAPVEMDAILIRDNFGNGYTYVKLRDLCEVLGIPVEWSERNGIELKLEEQA